MSLQAAWAGINGLLQYMFQKEKFIQAGIINKPDIEPKLQLKGAQLILDSQAKIICKIMFLMAMHNPH